MFRLLLLVTAGISAFAQAPTRVVGIIDFYGYGSLDRDALRRAVPFHVGDTLPSKEVRAATEDALKKLTGRSRVAVAAICCLDDGRSVAYIGLAESDAPPLKFNPKPTQDLKLPREGMNIFAQLDKDEEAAFERGDAGEDASQGYALDFDPASRASQLKLRDWTRAHVSTVYRVLEASKYPDQRLNAAIALGYAERLPDQIPALVRAAFDSDEGVRNAATRALGVLCNVGSEVTGQIPVDRFLPMLRSVIWTDRNKATLLFESATRGRTANVIDALRNGGVVPALREMAQWKNLNHSSGPAMILERIAQGPKLNP